MPKARIQLTFDVTVDLDSTPVADIEAHMKRIAEHAIENGMVTANTSAEIDDYTISIGQLPLEGNTPAVEAVVAAHLRGRIEDGNLDPAELAVLAARYGMVDPSYFVDEMTERTGKKLLEVETPSKPTSAPKPLRP